jgi:hypothetical protein
MNKTQIKMLIDRVNQNFNQRNEELAEKKANEVRKLRENQMHRMLQSVPLKAAKIIINRFDSYELPGIAPVFSAWEFRQTQQTKFRKMLADLEFDLVMADADGYKKIMKSFEAQVEKLFK